MTRQKTSLSIFGLGLILSIVALAAPRDVADAIVLIWSVGCSAAMLRSAFRMQAGARWAFAQFGISGFILLAGIVVRTLHGQSIGVEQPLPSPADLLHVPGYLLFLAATVTIYRSRSHGRRRDIDAWLDSFSLTLAVSLVLWALFLGDFVLQPEDTGVEIALHGGYNLVIFTTLLIVLRIGATNGRRPIAYYLLVGGIASFVVADLYATWASTTSATPFLTIALSPLIYGFCAAASIHPTGSMVTTPTDLAEKESEGGRVAFVIASLVAPVLVVLASSGASEITRATALAGSVGLALLVSVRVYRLIRSQRVANEKERLLAQELARIAQLGSTEEIYSSLIAGVEALVPEGHVVTLGEQPAMATLFSIPEPLIDDPAKQIVVAPALYTTIDKRIITSFVRDVGQMAQSLEVNQAKDRQRVDAEANRRIAVNERRFRALVQNASDVVLVLNPAGKVTYMSDSAVKVLGYETSAYVGKTLDWVVHENDWGFAQGYMEAFLTGTSSHLEHEIRAVHLDGSIRLLDLVLTDMRHVEGIEGIVINITDVTEKRRLESNLRDAETTDPLTMQLNRTAFIREIDTALRRTSISASSVSLAIVNLDDFRLVNEGYGTVTADQVLIEVAHRIRQSVRLDDIVARLNGDEFGILMPDGYSAFEAERVVQRILEDVTEPITTNGRSISLRATAGLVLNGDGSATGIDMLRDADTALDTAKTTSRGSVVLFEEAMGQEVSERIELRNLLQDALTTKKLRLAYQPIVDIDTGEIAALEALSRWQDDSRGNISPATFIPIAESAGMITELGEWALRTACEQVVEWARQGYDDFTVSVNMSGHQLREENVITKVSRILRETKVDPARITIEITESVLIDDTDFIAHRIRALRELGLRLAIDDFGTGYSSLSYLRRYEFDVLKIDRSFVIPLADDANKREREIVNAMIKLAQALGAITVAEGIEEAEEYGVLRTLGCDLAQGYLFWYPMESYEVIPALNVVPTSAAA